MLNPSLMQSVLLHWSSLLVHRQQNAPTKLVHFTIDHWHGGIDLHIHRVVEMLDSELAIFPLLLKLGHYPTVLPSLFTHEEHYWATRWWWHMRWVFPHNLTFRGLHVYHMEHEHDNVMCFSWVLLIKNGMTTTSIQTIMNRLMYLIYILQNW